MKRYIKKSIFLLVMFFAFGVGLKIIAYSLPEERIRSNIIESYQMMDEEGLYPQIGYLTDDTFLRQQLDNWSDAIYLNVAYTVENNDVLKYVAGDYYGGRGEDPIEQLGNQIEDEGNSNTIMYGRQWFGALGIVRILLYFFNLSQIRAISSVVFLTLLFAVGVNLSEKISKQFAYVFELSIILFFPISIFSSINISNIFYVSLGVIYYILNKNKDEVDPFIDLFICGCLTAYFDLFLTPFVSYGLVTAVVIMFMYNNGTISNFISAISALIKTAIGWLLGYSLFWITKWLFASIILRENVFLNTIAEMKNVSGGRVSWGPDTTLGYIREALSLNFNKMLPVQILNWIKNEFGIVMYIILLVIIAIILIWIFIKKHKSINQMYISGVFIIIACMPYAYYIIMHFHTFVHYWIEYRYQCMTVIGISMAYLLTLRGDKNG